MAWLDRISIRRRMILYLNIVKERILGTQGKALIEETLSVFAGWKPIRMEVAALSLERDQQSANRLARGKGDDYALLLDRKLGELSAYATKKAGGFLGAEANFSGPAYRDRHCHPALLAYYVNGKSHGKNFSH